MNNKFLKIASLVLFVSFFFPNPQVFAEREVTKAIRMLCMASMQPDILKAYYESNNTPNLSDMASFSNEVISFSPSKEELKQAYLSGQQMRNADTVSRSNPKKAIIIYLEAYKNNPYDVVLAMSIGVTYCRLGDKSKAIQYIQKAYDTTPDGYRDKDRIMRNLNSVKSSPCR